MLQIKNITKTYDTGALQQKALDNVSFNLRDNEFVSVLGHSGSGKTTLLNLIGGLDRYDDGDIIINDTSTKQYTDRDWDSYRNHSVGFVFQSYNLIPHQSVLANVELALTISGISPKERKERAAEALKEVGLGEHIHKRPNQLSGGQMQRVAIARALVNEPDILLADEPTGALDTETSSQIMDLLARVAKDRLVVMVTHNPELAEEYSNRIIELSDGEIISDSNPLNIEDEDAVESTHRNLGKASMSFATALSLSFNNLRSKKARTFLTAFAGSIGIIGIALILSLSTGVNNYIDNIQEDTMSAYPITIEEQSIDLESLISIQPSESDETDEERRADREAIYSNPISLEMISSTTSTLRENNLTTFKEYLDNPDNGIEPYVGSNGIVYSYAVNFDLFTYDEEDTFINTDGSTFEIDAASGIGGFQAPSSPLIPTRTNTSELMPGVNDDLISPVVTDNYEVVHGRWPEAYDEMILSVNRNNEVDATALYELGIFPAEEYEDILQKIDNGEELVLESRKIDYEELMDKAFYLLPASDHFVKDEDGHYEDISEDELLLEEVVGERAIEMTITGVVRAIEDATTESITTPVAYTRALTEYLIDYANESEVVQAQADTPEENVLTGLRFETNNDEEKIEDAREYLNSFTISEKADFVRSMLANQEGGEMPAGPAAPSMTEEQLAAGFDQLIADLDSETLIDIYDSSISTGSYDENMDQFGVVSLDAPSSISIYADNFEAKDAISAEIEAYNQTVDEEEQITYADFAGLIMSSVTEIINVITYVLIAFVSVSLVVSSIMIGIITYISVLERTKEIGILRAIGASKANISTVFNAETIIIGLFSGLLGVGITYLSHIPLNLILESLFGEGVRASLTLNSALILVVLSVVLSFIAGLIPSRQASEKDPVDALRTE